MRDWKRKILEKGEGKNKVGLLMQGLRPKMFKLSIQMKGPHFKKKTNIKSCKAFDIRGIINCFFFSLLLYTIVNYLLTAIFHFYAFQQRIPINETYRKPSKNIAY